MLIPAVDVAVGGAVASSEKFDLLKRLSWCGPLRIIPSLDSVSAPSVGAPEEKDFWKSAVRKWGKALCSYPCQVGPIAATSVEEVTQWLNEGAVQVIVEGSFDDLEDIASQLPRERLVARFSEKVLEDDGLLSKLSGSVGGVSIISEAKNSEEVVKVAERAWQLLGKRLAIALEVPEIEAGGEAQKINNQLVGKLHGLHSTDFPVNVVSENVSMPTEGSLATDTDSEAAFCVARSFVACLRTDRTDGLFATVVTDENGVALGLVYSSEQSVVASLACGRGVYWSRSRQSLWRKGDTSGAFQELVSIAFDCDADAMRFKVRQRGNPPAFCHQQTRTCWGYDGGIPHLFRTLESRKLNAPEGSYTKRLFEDKALLRNKLIEEAQEVIEAIEENDPEHVAREVADLAYFLFAACTCGNASLEDVTRQLDMRSLKVKRRPGNAKADRIAAGEAVLQAQQQKKSAEEPPAAPKDQA